ncbi:MAG: transglycosylase SLT domain-containing protein [Paenibacillaceae bacterium]|nr:transglycosylase SLT domain-containing protein [Paenibacillaceae bacterium]
MEKIDNDPQNPVLSKYDKLVESIQEYAEQQGDFLKLGSDTLRQYIEWIEHYTMDKNIDTLWVLAMIWQESRFNAAAVSSHGAIGLMQIMPRTGAAMGYTPDQLQDAEMNIAAGTFYLYSLLQKYEILRMAIIAYNQGSGNIQRGTYNTRYYEDVLRHHTRLSSKGR